MDRAFTGEWPIPVRACRCRIACYFVMPRVLDCPSLLSPDHATSFRRYCVCLSPADSRATFLSVIVTLLQIHCDETNRGRIMSRFGLINRGLGPMGSFPFAMIATGMTPFTTPFMTPFVTPFITH
jgi:hypothetical protein